MPPSAGASQGELLVIVAVVFPVSCVTLAAMCLCCDLGQWFSFNGRTSPHQKGNPERSSSSSSIIVSQPELRLNRSSSAVFLNRPNREEDFERRFSVPAGNSAAQVNVMQTNTSLLHSQMYSASMDGSQYGSTSLLLNTRRPSINSPLDPSQFNVDIYNEVKTQENVEESSPMGTINFCLLYEEELNILTVQIIQVRDLPEIFTKPGSFICTLSLLPDVVSVQSQIHHNAPNPIFMESFLFSVPLVELHAKTLLIKLFEVDRFSQKNIIGKIEQPLRDLLLDMKAPQHFLKKLKPCLYEEHGELSISLGYLPKAEKLTVTVLQARNINAIPNGSQGIYVKLTITVQNEKYVKTKKIMQKQGESNIDFNESLAFSYSSEQLAKANLLFQVIHTCGKEKIEVGRILFGKDSSEKILVRWKAIMSGQPARAIWYKLGTPEVNPVSP